MSCVGKETDFEVRRQFAGCKRFTPTRGVCVLATRDGTLLPGVQTICPRPGMREHGLQTGANIQTFRIMQFGNWKRLTRMVESPPGSDPVGTICPGLNPCGRVYSPDRDDDPGPG